MNVAINKNSRLLFHVFRIEKKTAYEIIKLSHDNVIAENEKIKAFERDVRQFLSTIEEFITEKDFNFLRFETRRERMSRVGKKEIQKIITLFSFHFSNFLKETRRKYIDNFIYELGVKTSRRLSEILEIFFMSIFQEMKKEELREAEETPSTEYEELELFKVDRERIRRYILKASWGGTIEDRLENIGDDVSKKIKNVLLRGFEEGKSYQEIIRATKKEVAISATRIEKIIRTEGQRVQNNILMKTYWSNRKYLSGIEYTASLDLRTCEICGAWDGTQFWFDARQGQNSIVDAPFIPIHPLCRCVYIPVSKIWEKYLGDFQRKRASMFGPTTGNYGDFLKELDVESPETVRQLLGKQYSLWKKNNFKISNKTLKLIPEMTYRKFLQLKKRDKK